MKSRFPLTLIIVAAALAIAKLESAVDEPPPSQSTVASPPSKEERAWAEDTVAFLVTPEEKKIYLSLPNPVERTEFRQEFWRLRERDGLPAPYGPEFHRLYLERFDVAMEKYSGWKSDAGRIVLAYGEPTNVISIDCSFLRPIEIWDLPPRTNLNTPPRLVFYRDFAGGPLKLWSPAVGVDALLEAGAAMSLQSQAISPLRGDQAAAVYIQSRCGNTAMSLPCQHECEDLWPAVIQMKTAGTLGALEQLGRLAKLPDPPEGDWKSWRSRFVEGGATAASVPAGAPKTGPAASDFQKLDKARRKELLKAIPERYHEWLDEVSIIITEAERDVFLQLADNVDRDRFIEQFWRRRSLDSDGIRTNFKETFRARVEYAKEMFKDLNSDAAKVYILNGPPDAMIPIRCEEILYPINVWYYERLEALRSKAYLIMYRAYGAPQWKLWLPIDGSDKLYLIGNAGNQSQLQSCFDYDTLRQAINFENGILGGITGMAEASKLFLPPPVETEGVDRFMGLTTQLAPDAAPIAMTRQVIFPEAHDNKIACDISLLLPRKDLALRDLGDARFYDIDVVGEVVQNDRLLENFKYRFDVPLEETAGDTLPVTVRRYLYPGSYELRLKASDGNHKGEGRLVEALTVPETPDQIRVAAAPSAAVAARPAAPSGDFRPSSISILPPVREILVGLQRFETRTADGITAVDFFLDGTKVETRRRSPFEADLDLGSLPRKHLIRTVAYDSRNRTVGEDELTVNEGSESFRVKITSPPRGTKASGPVPVTAEATAPEGKHIEKLEFFSNETRIATLFQPPWEQLVPIRKTGSLGYVRVMGTLDDGTVAEDLRYVNAPEYLSEVNVDAVELFTTVLRGSRPVNDLTAANFSVLEDGVKQTVAQFERVSSIPISVGVAIDTSASMIENLPEAETAAVGFLTSVLGEKDRGFTMSFDETPFTLCRLTSNRDHLQHSLAGLRAEGSTALYDAVVYGLFQFQGVKGKKALVVLTDGKDNNSKFDFDTLLDYVKKAGVSVYGIGLNISAAELDVKSRLNRLAQASGGTTFYISNTRSLAGVYKQIDDELRSQYLLTYYSTNSSTGGKWRRVDVKVQPAGLQVRTISGYYP